MPVPGSNLLTTALQVICRQKFEYYAFVSRSANSIGLYVKTFAPPVTVTGSVQVIDQKFYDHSGLDFSHSYVQVWTEQNVKEVDRDIAGDQIAWSGSRWEVVNEMDWINVDGWNSFIAVRVPTP